MRRMQRLKQTGKLFAALTASGICLSPVLSQQIHTRADTGKKAADSSAHKATVDKEVTLAADGSFRAVVLTRSGLLVPGARLTFESPQKDGGEPMQAMTGTGGLSVVSALKPGLYRVRVRAPQGVYQGNLRIVNSTATRVSFGPAPLVVFTLTHAPGTEPDTNCDADEGQGDCDEAAGGRLLPGVGRPLLWGLAGVGTAAAIALPLALQGEGGRRPVPRASP